MKALTWRFQFQDGAIRGLTEPFPRYSDIGFNSKMVRLEVDTLVNCNVIKQQFQFQDGAIRGYNIFRKLLIIFCFNSKMVRLEATNE